MSQFSADIEQKARAAADYDSYLEVIFKHLTVKSIRYQSLSEAGHGIPEGFGQLNTFIQRSKLFRRGGSNNDDIVYIKSIKGMQHVSQTRRFDACALLVVLSSRWVRPEGTWY
jgi:hypothetical protein